jgi:hypothetical protein
VIWDANVWFTRASDADDVVGREQDPAFFFAVVASKPSSIRLDEIA